MTVFPVIRTRFTWQLRTRSLALGDRTLLMAILNTTPDSFSDGGQYLAQHAAIDHGLRLLDEGADILDIGGESTRPNASPVSPEDEQARVLPTLKAIVKARPDAVLSIDTYHSSTARKAVDAGAEIVNDVSGLLWDADMPRTVADLRAGLVLMHTRGTPAQWATQPPLAPLDVLPTVLTGLRNRLLAARSAKTAANHIILDPGFGFGKRGDENFILHALLPQLHQFGLPIIVGTSRKGFLRSSLQSPSSDHRAYATTASNVAAILAGTHILRVHEIAPAMEAASVADAILRAANTVSHENRPDLDLLLNSRIQ